MHASIQPNGTRSPRIGITMGDPAGIGPEIIVKALAHRQVYESARPLVIGDATRLKTAAKIVSSPVKIRAVTGPANANYEPGQIDCVDLGLSLDDLPFGRVSPIAGEAAFRYVEKAAALALGGSIDAICTSPLSKEAMHAAGHRFPGHTELLAHLTGTREVSMMLGAYAIPCGEFLPSLSIPRRGSDPCAVRSHVGKVLCDSLVAGRDSQVANTEPQ